MQSAFHLDWTSTLLRIGGPGWLTVHLGFAAVFETLEGHPRVYGPTPRRFLSGFERLRDVVDLRDQLRRVDESRAVTRDGVEILARDTQMIFRVHSGNQPQPGRSLSFHGGSHPPACLQPARGRHRSAQVE